MDLRYLRYFIAIAEAKSFTRAAERLHTVQPSLSRQIRRLEEIVGTPLFYRDKHELRLTVAGGIFLEEARAILRHVDQAVMLAREGARAEAGEIVIGFVHGAEKPFFEFLFPRLRQKYPEMHVTFRSFSESELIDSLNEHSINAAFMNGPFQQPGVVTELFIHQKLVVALPADHALAKLKRVPLDRLGDLPFVGPSPESWPLYWEYMRSLAKGAGVLFRPADTNYDNALTTLQAVGMGVGFGVLPDSRIGLFPRSAVARPLDISPQPRMELLLAYQKNEHSRPFDLFLNEFREFKKEICEDGLEK